MGDNISDIQHLKIKRTYKYLMEAFLELLQEKPLEQISVVEICDRALVHRTTFYKHFEDKYHLLNYMIKEIKLNIEQALRNHEYQGVHSYSRGIVNGMFTFISENKSLHYSLLVQHNSKAVTDMIHQCLVDDIVSHLKLCEKMYGRKLEKSPEVVAQLISGGLISVLTWWIKDGMKIEKEKLVSDIEEMFNIMKLQ